ncbi:ATP-dependent nuclease [Paenibacillus sp. B01]|uniref:ATP-dependent nuclease n=1 Tax=Paenibacillus sp. B01 TaxID=2660554 RepID=UPI00129AB791|nr:AAA family ATPase [Paenibacillus sp. B01]QGG55028.1 AAA family ATPase [Paenibacillus sp. B01]
MYISKVDFRNFRNFKKATFHFTDGVNTLIGENGAGKTNVFHAMRLLLDDELPRSTKLTESDFNRSITDGWKGHWIIINMEFSDLDTSEGIQNLSHGIEHMDETSKGTYCMFYRPKKAVRQRLFEITTNGRNRADLNTLLSSISIDDYETVFTCRGTANFADDAIYNRFVGDFSQMNFPDPAVEAQEILGVPANKFSLYNEVSCTYVKALRDAVYELRNIKSNPLLNLMRGMSDGIDGARIIEQVNDLNTSISTLDEVHEMKARIRATLQNTVGITYSPLIDIKSQLPSDLEKLLQSLTLWVGDSDDDGYQGQLSELSLGGANLIYISLKLLEYELKISTNKVAHFLLIEEPESHIHTHIQKTLFEKSSYRNTQVIISTHSTHISAANKIRSVNILAKRKQEAMVFQPSNGLGAEECKKIERYLDAVRSNLLFAKSVILVEGDAELILIPAMFKAVFNISLDEVGISLVSVSSTVFTHVANLFADERIQRRCAIITDLDKSVIPLPTNPASDTPFQKKCRASQEVGVRRQDALLNEYQSNQWVNSYFANYTFEVDFLLNDNAYEIVNCLEQIYERPTDIAKSKKILEEQEVSTSGVEVLRLAKKVGKGWMAVLVAEEMSYKTYIPEYILDAVAFACSHLSDRHFEKMADFRIESFIAEDLDYQTVFEIRERLRAQNLEHTLYIEEYMKSYKENLPDDQLTELLYKMGL